MTDKNLSSNKWETAGVRIMQLNDQKAGMQGLDKELINKTIYEASKGTPYFSFQEKRQKSIDRRINDVRESMQRISKAERRESLHKMNILLEDLEANRNLSHSIVHIDMDAFYAAVEMRDEPELKDKPMAVGSSSMLSTSNYHARRYGVRAAMPGFIAKKLCPDLIIVPCNFNKYRQVSGQIQDIVKEYDPDYSAASLDEVYFDLTEYIKEDFRARFHSENCLSNTASCSVSNGDISDCDSCKRFKQPEGHIDRDKRAFEIVQEIRQRIYETTQLTASAGIAPNTMLAKVCSDQNKPNGQFQIASTIEDVKYFISTLPVKKVSGIGPVQGQILNGIDIYTCADMREKRDLVGILFTPSSVEFYMRVAVGIGSTTVKHDHVRKSIGVEETFRETHVPEELHKKCAELCEEMIEDLKSHNMLGKVVVLKLKTVDFSTKTRNHSLPFYSADSEIITKAAKKLLDVEIAAASPESLKLRLMGIRMANLIHADMVPASVKQHLKLKNFLQAKSTNPNKSPVKQMEEDHACPICCKKFHLKLGDFNDHVNQCINELCQSDNAEERCTSDLNPATRNPIENEGQLLPEKSNLGGDDAVVYICPVCSIEQNGKTLLEFNAHIDGCLNRSTIKEMLAEELHSELQNRNGFKRRKPELSVSSKSKKQKPENQTGRKIQDYFQSVF